MRVGLIILSVLTFISCNNTEHQSTAKRERIELIPEPDKDLRLAYEQQMMDSVFDWRSLKGLSDTILLKESSNIQDELFNEYLLEELRPIRKNFKRINSFSKWTSIKKIELWESTEGGEASYYYSDQGLEKIIVRRFGETFQIIREYYLLNANLSFVFDKSIKYNRPLYWDTTNTKENKDNQVWDFAQSEIIEERSYFRDGQLVHQLNSQDCSAPFSDYYLKKEGTRIRLDFEKLLDLKGAN